MSLPWVKVCFAAVVLLAGLGGALLPWTLGRRSASAQRLALGDTFVRGVLGGAGLIHLLSDGLE